MTSTDYRSKVQSRVAQANHRRQLRAQIPPPTTRRWMRQQVGLSQQDIAEVLGVARETVSRWETSNRVPSDRHLEAYVSLLHELSTCVGRQEVAA